LTIEIGYRHLNLFLEVTARDVWVFRAILKHLFQKGSAAVRISGAATTLAKTDLKIA
jgi:hypothetical protein